MSLFTRLADKSWETPGGGMSRRTSYRPPAAKVVLSCTSRGGSAVRARHLGLSDADGRAGMRTQRRAAGGRCRAAPAGVNTGVLMLASLAWERTRILARTRRPVGWGLIAGLLGLLFLCGQLLLWRQLRAAGHGLANVPAAAFFYLITALHGLHVIGVCGSGRGRWPRRATRRCASS